MYDLTLDRRHGGRRDRTGNYKYYSLKSERREDERRKDRRPLRAFPFLPDYLN